LTAIVYSLRAMDRERTPPMQWRPKHDRDSFKEVWLCFANDRGKFPLVQGQVGAPEYGHEKDPQRGRGLPSGVLAGRRRRCHRHGG
jgi:hypothetical protein